MKNAMNHIKIKNITTPYGYEELHWLIDGKSLPEYLEEWKTEFDEKTMHYVKTFCDLCPAWTKELDWYGDVRFVWKLIEKDSSILPVLLCPDDLDFSCIVMVVEVERNNDFVYWNQIGYVIHANEDFREEKEKGILDLEAYSDRDWDMYGDNIACADVDSEEWRQWISENWDEELYRRRMNYTYPHYQKEGSVCWIHEMNWVFARDEYDRITEEFWKYETLSQLNKFQRKNKITVRECAHLLSSLTRDGKELLTEHIYDYGEILLHLFASEQVGEPLVELLDDGPEDKTAILIYCRAIEIMWRYGNDVVVNVVDVTLLERLSDKSEVWERFGSYISDDFKNYINDSVLKEKRITAKRQSL